MGESATAIPYRFIETSGIRLHVAQAGDENAPLVILLHGFPDFSHGWHAQISFLVEHGYRVWAPDQRGYNLSDKPGDIRAYRMDALVQDVIGLIDAAGVEQVYLVGHDWGAAVAWGVALAAPQRVRKLVIMNVPHPLVFAQTLRGSFRQMLKSWYILFFQLPRLPEALLTRNHASGAVSLLKASGLPTTFTDQDFAQYVRAWTQPNAMRSMINWYRAIIRSQPNLSGDLRVHLPTLIIWGARDVALTLEMAQKSIEMCVDGRLVIFEDATHWVQHDKPNEVNALLADFLR